MWPFRRRSDDAPKPGDDADGGEVLRPARAEWRSVEPLRPVQATPLATIDRGFEQSLTTRGRPLFIESLSHHVHPSAPAGTVDGLAVPSAGVADGAARTYAAPTTTAQRITSADEPAPPAVQRSPVVTPPAPPTPAPIPTPTPAAPPAVDEHVHDVAPPPAHDVVSIGDPDREPPLPVAAIETDDHGPAEEVAERPLLSERAPIATPSDDDASTADPPPPVVAASPVVEPVQRRVETGTPSPARPTMRIGAPLPSSTETTLIGQREIRTDDGPVTSVAPDVSAAPAAPVPDRQAAPRLGAPLDPGLPVQRAPADPAPAALDDAVPADRSGDEVATVPATPGGPADRTPADGPAAPTSEAPLVGGDPIGPSTAPQRAVVEPSPSLSTAGVPHLAASAAPAVQRTVVDTPTSAAARPRVSRAIEPAATVASGTSIATDDGASDPTAGPVPTAEAPLVGSSEPLVELVSTATVPDSSPAGPVTASSDPATPGGIVTTAWADETTAAAVRPLDGGLLGDRPPTLTVDWADRAAPAGDTAPSPSGRAEAGAPSTPPVVSRTLADRTSRPSVATVAGVADATGTAPAMAPGRPPVLQFGPPPTPTAPVLSFDAVPADVGAARDAATSFELPASVQRQLAGEPATGPGETATVAVQTESVAAASPSTAVAAATGGATPGRSDAEIVELARVLYPQLQRRLARELLLDRERAGYRTDIRF